MVPKIAETTPAVALTRALLLQELIINRISSPQCCHLKRCSFLSRTNNFLCQTRQRQASENPAANERSGQNRTKTHIQTTLRGPRSRYLSL